MNRKLFDKVKEFFKMLWNKNMLEILDINDEQMRIHYYWITEGICNPDAEVFVKDEKIYAGIVDEYDEDELDQAYLVSDSFDEFKKDLEETLQGEDLIKYYG